jgi:hypothetical protein
MPYYPPIITPRPRCANESIELYWAPPKEGDKPNKYIIKDITKNFVSEIEVDGNTRYYYFQKLQNGTYYHFQIQSVGVNGTESSSPVLFKKVQPGFRPGDPTNPDYEVDLHGQIKIYWGPPYNNGYSDISHNLVTILTVNKFGKIIAKEPYNSRDESLVLKKTTYGNQYDRLLHVADLDNNYLALVQAINDIGYSSYHNFTDVFNPSISTIGLKLWIDPFLKNNCRTIINGDKTYVTKIIDKSKQHNDATAAIDYAPLYDGDNGFFMFTGSNYLKLPANSLPVTNEYSIFIYIEPINYNRITALSGGNSDIKCSLSIYTENNTLYQDQNPFNLNNFYDTTPFLGEFFYDGFNMSTYINGNLIVNKPYIDLNRNANILNNYIGTSYNKKNDFIGNIGDIIIYDRLVSDRERIRIENYILNRRPIIKTIILDLNALESLLLWLDAANTNTLFKDETTLVVDNDPIYKWVNKNSNLNYTSNDVYQKDLDYQPKFKTKVVNNKNFVEFSESFLVSDLNGTDPMDMYIVIKLKDVNDSFPITGSTYKTDDYKTLIYDNGFNITSNTNVNILNESSLETSTGLILLEWSMTDNNYIIRKNGTTYSYNEIITWVNNSNTIVTIGSKTTDNTLSLANAYIGEVVSFNKQLVYDDRMQIEGYLAQKWDIQYLLDDKHPYKYNKLNRIIPYSSGGPRNFNPSMLSNLTVWFDAKDSSSYDVNNDDKLTLIKDKSNKNKIYELINIHLSESTLGHKVFTGGSEDSLIHIDRKSTVGVYTADYTCMLVWQSSGSGDVITYSNMGIGYNNNSYTHNKNDETSSINDISNKYVIQTAIKYNTMSEYGNLIANYIDGIPGNFIYNADITNLTSDDMFFHLSNANIAEIVFYDRALTRDERTTVEAYLGWKWNIKGSFPYYHPYYYNNTLITDIQHLVLWYDANDDKTIFTHANNIVKTWNDKSGMINNTKTELLNPPKLESIDGIYYANFKNNGQMSSFLRCSLNNSVDNSLSYFIVGETKISTDTACIAPHTNPKALFMASKDYDLSGGNILTAVSLILDTTVVIAGVDIEDGQDIIMPVIEKHISGKYILELIKDKEYYKSYLNGVFIGDHMDDDTLHTDYKTFYIGGYTDALTSGGNIAEVIAYNNVLTDDERQRIEVYLGGKYGIPINNINPYTDENKNQITSLSNRRKREVPTSVIVNNTSTDDTNILINGNFINLYTTAGIEGTEPNYNFDFVFDKRVKLGKISIYGTYNEELNDLPTGFNIWNLSTLSDDPPIKFFSVDNIKPLDYNLNNKYSIYQYDILLNSEQSDISYDLPFNIETSTFRVEMVAPDYTFIKISQIQFYSV